MDMDKGFEMILHAGNSESASIMSIEAARKYDFEEAERNFEDANKELLLAHQIQTELIQAEAGGRKTEMSILMVHAQDHFTMASILKEVSGEFLNIYREMKELKEAHK